MSERRVTTLDQLGRIITGKTPPSTLVDAFGGEIPFVTPSDMDGRRIINATARNLSDAGVETVKGARVPANSIMVSCIGSDMGKAAIAGSDCVTNQQINSIIVETDDSPLYVYYDLSTRKDEIRGAASGSAQPILNKSAFGRLEITLPKPAEQSAIAHILGTLDDKIELNHRMNETLESIARAIFKSWFVDFDPVCAKASGEPPESICRRLGLTPEILGLFPDRFDDSELGEIPVGWKTGTLDSYAQLNPESWTKANPPVAIEYVDLANTKWGKIEATQSFAWKSAPSRAQRVLRPGDTIVGTVRPGNGSFALIGDDGLTGSTGFAVLRPKKPIYEAYVYLWVTRKENIERLAHLADGAAYPAVNPEVVLGTSCLLLCDKLIDQFGVLSKSLLKKAVANERESRTLSIIRDTLLPKLISGELRVPEATA